MDEDEVKIISKGLIKNGVTSFLPTTMRRIYKAFDNIIKAKR